MEVFNDSLLDFALVAAGTGLGGFLVGILFGRSLARRQNLKDQNIGEAAVRRVLSKHLSGKNYHIMNDITLSFEDGTTQIDHIVVARTGVFVIETKHFSGWIFGDADSPYWTQVIFQLRSRFQNPIRQNYKHLLAVRQLLNFLPTEYVKSAVVFTGSGEFKTKQPDGVFDIGGLVGYICSFTDEVISENRMHFCVGRLETHRRLISRTTDFEHQTYLNRKFGDIR